MKIVTSNNKNKIILSKSDWISIGRKANWLFVEATNNKLFVEATNNKLFVEAKFGDSVKKKYLEQGISESSIDYYIRDFNEIRKQKPKELFQEEFQNNSDFTIPINKRNNIEAYHNFKDLEFIVDYVKGQRIIGGNEGSSSDEGANIIYQEDGLTIMRADNAKQAIDAKGDYDYSWCIARNDGGNLFNSYRYNGDEPTFYFVRNDNKPKDDPYHFFVVQVSDYNNYAVTSGENDGDIPMLWDTLVKTEPKLEGKQDLFKYIPVSAEVRERLEYYDNFNRYLNQAINSAPEEWEDDDKISPYDKLSQNEFSLWPYENKKEYLEYKGYLGITDRQFESLPKDLRNLYISVGGNINENKYQLIKDDKQLINRLIEISKRKIDNDPMSFYNLPYEMQQTDSLMIAKCASDYKKNPENYPKYCPDELIGNEEVEKGVINGWKSRLNRNRNVYEIIPDEFKNNQEVHKVAVEVWNEFLRGNASSYDLLPIELQKDPEIIKTCVDYFVDFILNRDTDIPGKKGDYSGIKFVPEGLRNYPEIQEARLKKWIDLASVPIEHGDYIPEDLKDNPKIQESLLNGWIYEISADPWTYLEVDIPLEIKNNPKFKEVLLNKFIEELREDVEMYDDIPEEIKNHPSIQSVVNSVLTEARCDSRNLWASSFNDNYLGILGLLKGE